MTRVQILVPISFSKKKYKDSLKKQLILGLGQVIYKISLEHLVLPESKEVIEKKKMEICQSHITSQPERASSGQNWKNWSK